MDAKVETIEDVINYIEDRIKHFDSMLLFGKEYDIARNELWDVKIMLKKLVK